MKKKITLIIFVAFSICMFTHCNHRKSDYKEVAVSYTTYKIKCPLHMAPPAAGGLKTTMDFYTKGDTIMLYYYSKWADSIYIFDVTDTPYSLTSHLCDVNIPDKEKVLAIKPITRDSIFLLCERSVHIFDIKRDSFIFYKSIPLKYLLLSRYNIPVYFQSDSSVYTELIERNAPMRESGILDTRYMAKLNLKSRNIDCLWPKVPDDKAKLGGKKYFTIFQDKLFYSYSNLTEINIFNLSNKKLKRKELHTPVNLEHNIQSEKPNDVDRIKENALRNTYFGELFANDHYLYRVQYLPLPARNKEGLMPGFNQKEAILLEYNEKLNLRRVLKPEPGLNFMNYLTWHDDKIYGLKHTSKSITIYKIEA